MHLINFRILNCYHIFKIFFTANKKALSLEKLNFDIINLFVGIPNLHK